MGEKYAQTLWLQKTQLERKNILQDRFFQNLYLESTVFTNCDTTSFNSTAIILATAVFFAFNLSLSFTISLSPMFHHFYFYISIQIFNRLITVILFLYLPTFTFSSCSTFTFMIIWSIHICICHNRMLLTSLAVLLCLCLPTSLTKPMLVENPFMTIAIDRYNQAFRLLPYTTMNMIFRILLW